MAGFPTTVFINDTLTQVKTGHYLALYTATPNAGGGGTEVTGYTRLPVDFGSISGGSMSNTQDIIFATLPTANITHYGIIDDETGGTLKIYGPLSAIAAVVSGDQIKIPVGGLTVSLSGS